MRYAKLIPVLGLLLAQFALPASANAAPVGATCGGFFGIQCDPGAFCNFPTGTCGRFDMLGTCASLHFAARCSTAPAPVCGCDGRTYRNDCLRESGGVSKAHAGRCASPYRRM